MLEKMLALRYIKQQKRHSLFTISSIAIALALMTLLFIGYSTYMGILRDSACYDKPYHFKLMRLTDEEYNQLAANPDFLSCKRVVEPNYTISAEIMLKTYHDEFGMYVNTLFPEKYIYTDLTETFKEDLIDVNYDLIELDQLDLYGRYNAVRKVAVFFIFILFLVLALRLMIDTAFEISSKERERQFGMLQCMGATPGQIVRIITFEGMFLSVIGIPAGVLLGMGVSVAAFSAISSSGIADVFFTAEKTAQVMHMHINPILLVLAVVTGLVWVFLSAYQTGMRIIKMSPIQAISGRSNKIVKINRFSLFGSLFGWKGKLAARNNQRQPKRFAITVVSLTLSIALFASFSIVLKQSLATFEKTVELLGLNYDMGVSIQKQSDDPLGYRKGLDLLNDSGYFEINDFYQTQLGFYYQEDGSPITCILLYYPREIFDQQFDGEPPVSYDELTEQNSYLVQYQVGATEGANRERFEKPETLTVEIQSRTLVSDEAYEKMTSKERENVNDYIFNDLRTGEKVLKYRYINERIPAELTLAGAAPEKKMDDQARKFAGYEATGNVVMLVSTLDYYENHAYKLAGNGSFLNTDGTYNITLNLKDESNYEKAKTYISMNSASLTLDEDFYGDLMKMRTVVGAIKIGVGILSILIGLIALVNMVNILSTGILNRKSELAAMQCLGMTQGQLNGMTVIECLQYALTAGVLATLLLEGLMYTMLLFLKKIELDEVFGEMLNFTEPLPRIWIAAVIAFATAVVASFIPLLRMQKESLTDQIRTIE